MYAHTLQYDVRYNCVEMHYAKNEISGRYRN